MATLEFDMLAGVTWTPDASGLVWQEPFPIDATNKKWELAPYVFETPGSTRNELHGSFKVPQNYVSTPKFIVYWSCPGSGARGGATDIELDVDYRAVAVGESVDQSGEDESLNTNDTDSDTANILMEATITPAANFTAGDFVQILLARDGSDAGDDLNDKIQLWYFGFRYNDA